VLTNLPKKIPLELHFEWSLKSVKQTESGQRNNIDRTEIVINFMALKILINLSRCRKKQQILKINNRNLAETIFIASFLLEALETTE
jgi:hypothetical protein